MLLKRTVLLLPGYELDGFPRTAPDDQADDLLSGWIAQWHPRLLAAASGLPEWEQVEHVNDNIEGTLYVLPSVCDHSKPDDLESKIEDAGGKIIRAKAPWTSLRSTLISAARLGEGEPQDSGQSQIDEALLERFAALGYIYLQIQLMTRQLRYSTMLDVPSLEQQVLKAADAAIAGDTDETLKWLQAGFDSIGQERDHYYSLDVHLVDLTLLAETTLKKSLDRQLATAAAAPTAMLASASMIRKMKEESPERFAEFKRLLDNGQIAIAGGLDTERPHTLLTREEIVADFTSAREAYYELGITPPNVFARMSYGQLSNAPSLLKRLGFDGTLLLSFGDGEYPSSSQAKMTWEGNDGVSIAALSGEVFDASSPSSFLALGWEVGDALDHQHVPTVIFAHWPGQSCLYKRLVEIAAEATPALGRWKLLSNYFSETDDPYHQERLDEASFRYNWLGESESPCSLLARVDTFHQIAVRMRSLRTLEAMYWLVKNKPSPLPKTTATEDPENGSDGSGHNGSESADYRAAADTDWAAQLVQLRQAWQQYESTASTEQFITLKTALKERVEAVTTEFAKLISGSDASGEPNSIVVFNVSSSPVRESVTTAANQMIDECPARFAEGRAGEERVARTDVPSLGFVRLPLVPASGAATGKPLAEVGGLLRNEFLQAEIDTGKGHLRSLHFPGRRGNRLSLQIARRTVDDQGEMHYTQMDASNVRMLTSSNVQGLVRSTGKFTDGRDACGKFEIDYSVDAGGRLLNVYVKLDDLQFDESETNPWVSAYVIRIAWANEAAILRTHSAEGRRSWAGAKAIAPLLIDIDETEYHTHYLTGGLAFHRKTGPRFMETILAAKGQQSVRQRIAIGVDLPNPTQAATRVLDQCYWAAVHAPKEQFSSGWFFSSDLPGVEIHVEAPLVDQAGKNVGVRLSATELNGKSTTACLRSMHDVARALRVDYLGQQSSELSVDGDQVSLPLRANEHTWLDLLWA